MWLRMTDLLNGIVRFLRWHIQKSLLCLAKFGRLFVEFLFVFTYTADAIFAKILQWHDDLFVCLGHLCEWRKEIYLVYLDHQSLGIHHKRNKNYPKSDTQLTILSRSSSILAINLLNCLRLSTITCSSSVCVEPMHSKLNSPRLLDNVRCVRDRSVWNKNKK